MRAKGTRACLHDLDPEVVLLTYLNHMVIKFCANFVHSTATISAAQLSQLLQCTVSGSIWAEASEWCSCFIIMGYVWARSTLLQRYMTWHTIMMLAWKSMLCFCKHEAFFYLFHTMPYPQKAQRWAILHAWMPIQPVGSAVCDHCYS